MVSGSLHVLRLLPPQKLVTMILLKVALNTIKSNQISQNEVFFTSTNHIGDVIKFSEAKVYNIFNTVIGLSNICCSKQPFSNFPCRVALHFRILQNFKHPSCIFAFIEID
jgi:hypothetical protein